MKRLTKLFMKNMLIKIKITNKTNSEILKTQIDSIINIELEDYVFCVVAAEIGNAPYEACCAQAIASRTLAYSHYLRNNIISDNSKRWQAFRAKALYEKDKYPNIKLAIENTKNLILTYDNKCILEPVFSANNGGMTISSKQRWGHNIPYLISQIDEYDTNPRRGHGVGLSQEGAIARAKAG